MTKNMRVVSVEFLDSSDTSDVECETKKGPEAVRKRGRTSDGGHEAKRTTRKRRKFSSNAEEVCVYILYIYFKYTYMYLHIVAMVTTVIYVLVKAPSRVQYGNCRMRGVVETMLRVRQFPYCTSEGVLTGLSLMSSIANECPTGFWDSHYAIRHHGSTWDIPYSPTLYA